MNSYIIKNIMTNRRIKHTPCFEYPIQAQEYIKKKLLNSKYLEIKKFKQCKATTKAGQRCQHEATLNGYCIVHYKTFLD